MKKVKGLSKEQQQQQQQQQQQENQLIDTDYSMVITRGNGGCGDVEGKEGINGNGRRLD